MKPSLRLEPNALAIGALDERWMAAALSLGRRNLGQTFPNPAVGALLMNAQRDQPGLIARGYTARGGRPHAEIEALGKAAGATQGATLYVTLEPCLLCTDALIAAGIARVVAAIEDPNPAIAGRGLAKLRAAGVDVVVGPGAAEAQLSHCGHLRRMRDGRPHLILKLAVSADGKTGLAGRKPAEISCGDSRAEAHMLRASADAVLIGIGTAVSDDPQLTCRLPGMANRSPIRIVLDGSLRLNPSSYLFRTAHEQPLWCIARQDAPAQAELRLRTAGAEVLRVGVSADGRIDLEAALGLLGERGITRLLVEGGPILSAGLIGADLVDEAIIVQSPVLLGDEAIAAIEGMGLEDLMQSPVLHLIGRRTIGADTLSRMIRK